MRTAVLSILAVVAGATIGMAATWYEFRGVNEHFEIVARTKLGNVLDLGDDRPPLAVVEGGPDFDFGVLNHGETHKRNFVIRNEGGQPLVVSWDRASCGMCIQNADGFTTETVPPGESCEIVITYATKKPSATFSESAQLTTNDPTQSTLLLRITGDVIKAVRAIPEKLAFGTFLASEEAIATTEVLGFDSDKLEFLNADFSKESTKSLFEVTTRPLEKEELAEHEHAKSGFELKLHIKKGMPLGPVSQTVTVATRTGSGAEHLVDLEVSGTVAGDLSLIGRNVNSTESTISLGLIQREKGLNAEFYVLVKGPHRENVKLTISKVDPEFMKVEVGEPTQLADGKVFKWPVKIVIPPGAPVMSRLGNQQGPAGEILLNTTHPDSKELPIQVRLVIE